MITFSSSPAKAWISHVAPFVAWLLFMLIPGEPAGWKYALRSAASLALFLYLRPWKWEYPSLSWRHLPGAVLAGVAVLAVWILPESGLVSEDGSFQNLYRTVAMQPPWDFTPVSEARPYAPDTAGWMMTLIRLTGSAFVIALVEEFFWRSWLTRWLNKEQFLEVDPGAVSTKSIVITSLLFASVHTRWIAALICGLIWGFYYRKTRDIWAVGISHVITNLLMGVYVLTTGNYDFWA